MTASQDPKQFLQADIPRFIVLELISRGKFMKTFSGKIEGNNIIVKIYFRSCDDDLIEVNRKLSRIWLTLSPTKYPNLLPYQMWFKSPNKVARSNTSPTYLIRQYLHSSLNDRLSTRPFLNDIEKRFIIYQLMRCLEICHEQNICHGDVSPENIMITSWNWLVLTDFSPYKPTKIPVDDPSDFTYFYDSMGRRRCYLSPERFYERSGSLSRHASTSFDGVRESSWDATEAPHKSSLLSAEGKDDVQDPVLPSMDVYALGCTIADIFLGGEPLLDLSATLQYIIAPPHVANLAQEDSTVGSNIHRIKGKLFE
jgi:phosphoinositide-3-kinase, regulatory subunit 4